MGLLADVLSMGKHVAVGAAIPFTSPGDAPVANPVGILKYRKRAPVMLEQAPAALYQLYNLGAGYAQDHGVNIPTVNSPYLNHMVKDVQDADTIAHKNIGVGEPTTTAEAVAEGVGAFLVPGPHVKVAKTLIKPITAATKVGKAAQVAGNAGRVAAQVGVEAVLPGNNSGIKAIPIAGAVSGAASDAIDAGSELNGGPGIPGYTSVPDLVNQKLQPQVHHSYLDYIQGDDALIYKAAQDVGDQDTQAMMEGEAQARADHDNTEAYSLPKPDWEDEAIKGAILATGAAALVMGRGVVAKGMEQISTDPAAIQSLMGGVRNKTSLGIVDQAVTNNIQHDQPLRAMERKMAKTSDELQQREADLDQVTAPALNSRIHHAVNTGEFGHNVTAEPTVRVAEDYARLAPEEQQIVAEGLLANRALEEFQRTGNAVQFTDLGNNPVTGEFDRSYYVQQLKGIIGRMQSDDRFVNIADRVHNQYRKMLDLHLAAGITSKDEYDKLTLLRPSYVPVRKNIIDEPFDDILGLKNPPQKPPTNVMFGMMSAGDEQGAGVKLSEAANPVHIMFDEWTNHIRNAEVNAARRDILSRAAENDELSNIITKLPTGERPNTTDDIATVFENGKPQHYKISDPYIHKALEMNPFAMRGSLSAAVNAHRKIIAWSNTGLGSVAHGYFAPKAAAMDAILGSILKPKGMHAGMMNEIINKLKKPGADNPFLDAFQSVLSRVDPTGANPIGVLLNVPIGTIRGIHDDIVKNVAQSISMELRNDGFLKSILPDETIQALELRSAQAFSNTTKARMQEAGAANASLYGSNRPSELSAGTLSAAPNFAADIARANAQEAMRASNASAIAKILANSKSAAIRVAATPLSRIIHSINQNIHESYRYQMFAANEGRFMAKTGGKVYVNDEAAKRLIASQVRRISGDVGQTGGSRLYQELSNAVVYSNVGIQTLAQMGRMFAKQPVTTLFNSAYMLSGIAATYLASLYLDPNLRFKVGAMTPEQRAANVPLAEGLSYDLPQEVRPVVAPFMAMLDEVTGMNNLDENALPQFNEDFGKAAMQWIDSGMPMSDENKFEYQQMMSAALKSLNPLSMNSIPGLDVANAIQGVDLNRTSMTGQPSEIPTQTVSPSGGDGELEGDFISAQTQKVIQTLIGSTLSGVLRPAMDAHRALSAGATANQAEDVLKSRLIDQVFKSPTNLAGQIWGDYTRALPKSTLESELYYKKVDGLKKIQDVGNKDIWERFTTGKDPRSAVFSVQDAVPPNLMNTASGAIYAQTIEMVNKTKPLTDMIYQINKNMNEIDNLHVKTIQERNDMKNELLAKRQVLQQRLLNVYTTREKVIRQIIGDPTFTYQDFDPVKYSKMPLPTVSPVAP